MKFSKVRTALLTCILGVVSVSFFKFEYEKWNVPYFELPQVTSESPIIVYICEEPNLPQIYPHGAIPKCNYDIGGGISVTKAKTDTKSSTLVRKLFLSLPEKYFYVECCNQDKNKYLDRLLGVEDDENGYMEGKGDAAQPRFKMSLFKQSNGRTIIGLYVFGEDIERSHFLEYKNKKWRDIGREVVPQYKKSNIYEFSLSEKKAEVFAYIKVNGEYEYRKVYDLVWENNRFVIEAKITSAN